MVIPIPQYKDFATISSLKELNWWLPVPTTQRFYGFDPGLAAKRLEMINLKLCSDEAVDLV
jgi:hypothetical protein